MTDLQTAARALNGRVVSGWVRFAPPGHSRSDDSGAMRLDPTSDDGIRVKTFSLSDDPILVREYVRDRLGIVASGRRSSATPPSPRLAFTSGPDDAERKANAIAIWREARDPRGTPVQVISAIVASICPRRRLARLSATTPSALLRARGRPPWSASCGTW
jgi:hypothetical protein